MLHIFCYFVPPSSWLDYRHPNFNIIINGGNMPWQNPTMFIADIFPPCCHGVDVRAGHHHHHDDNITWQCKEDQQRRLLSLDKPRSLSPVCSNCFPAPLSRSIIFVLLLAIFFGNFLFGFFYCPFFIGHFFRVIIMLIWWKSKPQSFIKIPKRQPPSQSLFFRHHKCFIGWSANSLHKMSKFWTVTTVSIIIDNFREVEPF